MDIVAVRILCSSTFVADTIHRYSCGSSRRTKHFAESSSKYYRTYHFRGSACVLLCPSANTMLLGTLELYEYAIDQDGSRRRKVRAKHLSDVRPCHFIFERRSRY